MALLLVDADDPALAAAGAHIGHITHRCARKDRARVKAIGSTEIAAILLSTTRIFEIVAGILTLRARLRIDGRHPAFRHARAHIFSRAFIRIVQADALVAWVGLAFAGVLGARIHTHLARLLLIG
jgi:hypothetical protein